MFGISKDNCIFASSNTEKDTPLKLDNMAILNEMIEIVKFAEAKKIDLVSITYAHKGDSNLVKVYETQQVSFFQEGTELSLRALGKLEGDVKTYAKTEDGKCYFLITTSKTSHQLDK